MPTNLQEEHAELQERYVELRNENQNLKARIAELEKLVASKPQDVERECFHKTLKSKIGPVTRGQWMPFCPLCEQPVNEVPLADGKLWAVCSIVGCKWVG